MWCEGLGFYRNLIMRHLASSHIQEASPRKFNVQADRVDSEVNWYFKLKP